MLGLRMCSMCSAPEARRVKLGKTEIDALVCPEGRADCLVFDDEIPGFALRVTQAGAKVFILQYRRGAIIRRLRIGRYGELTPAKARKLAEAARGLVIAGGDPAADRKAMFAAEAEAARERRSQAKADALTLEKLIGQWEMVQLAHRSASYRTEAPRALRRVFQAHLDLPARNLEADTIRAALAAIGGKAGRKPGGTKPAEPGAAADAKKRERDLPDAPAMPGQVMARRVRSYGAVLFNWAIGRELLTVNPFAAVRPEGREVARERSLTDAELGEVWRAAGTLGWPWGPYFRFLLLTLQREGEAAGLAWSELSPGFALWELPGKRTKNGKAHAVHLAEPARDILRAVPRMAGSPLVFTTTGRTPISGFSRAKARLDAAIIEERAERAAEAGADAPAPLVPWRLHDFRRTGVTVLARQGVRWEVADRVLNHVQGAIRGVAAVYQRHEFFDERERAMTIWAEHILAVGRKKSALASAACPSKG